MKWALTCLTLVLLASSRAEAQYPAGPQHPRVCVASYDKGDVKLRYFSGRGPEQIMVKGLDKDPKGEMVEFTYTIERRSILEQVLIVEAETIEVYSIEGKQLDNKALSTLLAKETRVLACSKKPELGVLTIAKPGTLLLVVPVSMDRQDKDSGPPAAKPR
jgi:hypothetical protein